VLWSRSRKEPELFGWSRSRKEPELFGWSRNIEVLAPAPGQLKYFLKI
jgi:hypothetical protein